MPPLTFLNSIFLAGLAAAALPILIHLFSRRKTREARFPSLEFLHEVSRKKIRRLQLRQFLLLAMRVLIIGFFALALSRPALKSGGGALGRGSSTIAIILDNSYSMGARDPAETEPPSSSGSGGGESHQDEGTVFADARSRALEIVSLLREGDRGLIAFAAAPVRVPYQTAIADAGLLRQEIEKSSVSAMRADLAQSVERMAAALQESRTLNRELYIISDFQRIDVEAWQTLVGGSGPDSLRGRKASSGPTLPEGTRVVLLPARTLPVDNMAVTRVRLDPLGAGTDGGARIVATVANHSDHEARDAVLRAVEDGASEETLGESFVTVPAHGESEALLLIRRMPGTGGLRIVLSPDGLQRDNQGFLVTDQPGTRSILILSGADDPASDAGVHYLTTALDPAGTREFFRIETKSASDPGLAELGGLRADAIVMLDVGRLSDATREALERYHAEGGGIFVVLGERCDPRTYNTTILPKLADVEILGLSGDPRRGDVYRSLRVTASGHPIFEGFPTASGGNLSSARFVRVMETKPGPRARVLAEFSGGLPALLEQDAVLILTSSLDGKWNDLVTSGAFLPLAHRSLQHLTSQGSARDRILVGASYESPFDPAQVGTQEIQIVDPAGGHVAAERSESEGKIRVKSGPLPIPGIYRVIRGDGVTLGLFAVNLDTRESDLRLAPESWLPRLFDPDALVLGSEGRIDRATLEERGGRELWPMLLVAVLLLMTAESLLGRGKLLP
jgi:hypothetical protein